MNLRHAGHVLAIAVTLLASVGSAEAAFRAYISSTGNDANACTLAAPCRLLPAALAAADDGGEVWMLDSANYNTSTVTITKSVSIVAVPGAVGSVLAQAGGHAIVVNGANIKVGLRNLVVVNLSGGQSGIVFTQGVQLAVEDCDIQGLPLYGIHAPVGNAKLLVRNTTIRRAGTAGIFLEFAMDATVDNVRLYDNGTAGIIVGRSSKATITDSLVTGGQAGILVDAMFGGITNATIERSMIRNAAQFGIWVNSHDGIGSTANLVLRRSVVDRADTGILVQTGAANVSSFVSLDQTVVSHNRLGLTTLGIGTMTVETFANNTFAFNTQQDTTVGFVGLTPR